MAYSPSGRGSRQQAVGSREAQSQESRSLRLPYCLLPTAYCLLQLGPLLLLKLDVQRQALDLVAENVEAGRRAGLQRVLALDHRLVDLRPALHVVALDGQQLLQDVGRAVG